MKSKWDNIMLSRKVKEDPEPVFSNIMGVPGYIYTPYIPVMKSVEVIGSSCREELPLDELAKVIEK